ncbi:MAG: ribulose-phosphate 3-epimerase [Bacilli bacterium]|nr:ribulose-phosphate 3-epimerase [Bacilli bacterium]
MKISVSILKEKDNIKDVIEKINLTDADYIHIDVQDNTYTSNISFPVETLNNISDYNNKKLDIHLMSNNPEELIDEYSILNPEYITFHLEATNNPYGCIQKIKSKGIKVGIALNPETDINNLVEYLPYIDLVLVMSVTPGLGGQSFLDNTSYKMEEISKLKERFSNYIISADGGINDKTINLIRDYVDMVVSGSFITDSNDYQYSIDLLKE